MGNFARNGTAAALAAVMASTGAGQANATGCLTGASADAAMLRQLDVMLLVSSLRCRLQGVDFRPEYNGFLERNRDELGVANRTILAEMSPANGTGGAADLLDRMSVSLANHYGQDTATAPCAELRQAAAELAAPHDPGALLAAAQDLIGDDADASTCAVRYAAR